ncbi:hypothetical protein BACCOP_03909 [Phocaeicola coprocola DSM 17136]|uniref:Uncharacterized protein n=1 Tax=Phocaeicola coprocola DSM 17136 TaxID=470145 RepID=B3JPE7_9BACT|nr:hypothetical protein BACCOP_03909 [Phocaeicola coprocola DSM 17136]
MCKFFIRHCITPLIYIAKIKKIKNLTSRMKFFLTKLSRLFHLKQPL